MTSSRHLSRIAVVQALFAYEFQSIYMQRDVKIDPEDVLKYVLEEFGGKVGDSGFAYELLQGVVSYENEIREKISKHAPSWPFDKIAPVDRAVLEVGVFEILYSKDVPPVVAIDEAIEVAKAMGNDRSPQFVNGVLSAVMEEYKSKKKVP